MRREGKAGANGLAEAKDPDPGRTSRRVGTDFRLPLAVGKCHFTDPDCLGNACLPQLEQAPKPTNNSAWTGFFGGASTKAIEKLIQGDATAPMVHVTTGQRLPSLAEAEHAHIVRVLEAVQWNKKEAARILEISRGTLYRKITDYQLVPEPRAAGGRRRRGEGEDDV